MNLIDALLHPETLRLLLWIGVTSLSVISIFVVANLLVKLGMCIGASRTRIIVESNLLRNNIGMRRNDDRQFVLKTQDGKELDIFEEIERK